MDIDTVLNAIISIILKSIRFDSLFHLMPEIVLLRIFPFLFC